MLWDFEHILIKYLWVVDEPSRSKKPPTFDYVPCRYKRNYDVKYGMLWSMKMKGKGGNKMGVEGCMWYLTW